MHVYNSNSERPPLGVSSAITFWNDANKLKAYDMIILSCECSENLATKGRTEAEQAGTFAAMTSYLASGGRIFTTDYMYTWYRYSPDVDLRTATSIRGGAPDRENAMQIDTSFPKGQALSDWLLAAAGIASGKVEPEIVFGNIISNDSAKSRRWATDSGEPRVFSVNLPVSVPADQQCGKGVHIDAHVNNPSRNNTDSVGETYPDGCGTPLKQAENLLAFFFFDLASCIQSESEPPKPPVVK